MEKYNLTEKDKEYINNARIMAKEILNIYNKIGIEKSNNRFNDIPRLRELLINAKALENSIYDYFKTDIDKLNGFLNEITPGGKRTIADDVKDVVSNDPEKLINARITLRLIDEIMFYLNKTDNNEVLKNYSNITYFIRADFMQLLGIILGEFKVNKNFSLYREWLISYQLNLNYIYGFMENIFINNKLKDQELLIWYTNLIADVYNISSNIINYNRQTFSADIIISLDSIDSNFIPQFIYKYAVLRSSFVMLCSANFESLKVLMENIKKMNVEDETIKFENFENDLKLPIIPVLKK